MKWGRRIFWILVVLFLFLVISQFTQLQKLVQTLQQGRWQWVLIAALLQIGYYLIYTAVYRASFYAVGVDSKFRKLIPLVFAMMFVNVAAPAGGAGGAALFIEDARRRGESPSRTAAGTLLAMIADFGSFVLILIAGMVYLFTHHDLKSYEILTAILLLLLVGGLSAVLFMGVYNPDRLRRLLVWIQKRIIWFGNRIHKADLVADNWAEKNASEYIEASLAMITHPGRLWITMAVAFGGHLVNLLSLHSVFVAFNQVVSPGMLVAGYAMGILFWIISITPQGIVVVVGMMTLVFTSLGVSPEKSASLHWLSVG